MNVRDFPFVGGSVPSGNRSRFPEIAPGFYGLFFGDGLVRELTFWTCADVITRAKKEGGGVVGGAGGTPSKGAPKGASQAGKGTSTPGKSTAGRDQAKTPGPGSGSEPSVAKGRHGEASPKVPAGSGVGAQPAQRAKTQPGGKRTRARTTGGEGGGDSAAAGGAGGGAAGEAATMSRAEGVGGVKRPTAVVRRAAGPPPTAGGDEWWSEVETPPSLLPSPKIACGMPAEPIGLTSKTPLTERQVWKGDGEGGTRKG